MKKHIKLLTIGTLLLGGLTGCNDFLDREPLDKVIPEKYFAWFFVKFGGTSSIVNK